MSNVVYWQNRQCIVIQIYCAAKFAKRGGWSESEMLDSLFFLVKKAKSRPKK